MVAEFSILVVDDDESNLHILNHILKADHSVYVAKTGKSALERAHKNKPDLILLDVIMPDMSGFEVITQLKESDATRDIPVIIITGLDNHKDEQEGFRLGAVDYITKPFHSSIVKARIETHLKIVKQIRTIERFGWMDALTGIPNRRSFDNQINLEWGKAIHEKTNINLLMIDIDNFKNYNDTYGHPQGDVLLKSISKIFLSTLKHTTDLVFRWGGEEFMVLLPDTDKNTAWKVAEDIRMNVEQEKIPCHRDGVSTSITVSIGISGKTPTLEDSVLDLVSDTDNALYMAKKNGKNRVCAK